MSEFHGGLPRKRCWLVDPAAAVCAAGTSRNASLGGCPVRRYGRALGRHIRASTTLRGVGTHAVGAPSATPDVRDDGPADNADVVARSVTSSTDSYSTAARLRSWWMGADSPLVGLADRELATLALIADGLSNEAIAGRLHVSVRTVEAVCATIFRKLDLAEQPETNRRVRAAVLYVNHARDIPDELTIPHRWTSFVGRGNELDDLGHLLEHHRWLTIIGPGGSGKTSLAIALAAGHLRARGRARFVDLVPVRTPGGVVDAVCDSFGVVARERSGRPTSRAPTHRRRSVAPRDRQRRPTPRTGHGGDRRARPPVQPHDRRHQPLAASIGRRTRVGHPAVADRRGRAAPPGASRVRARRRGRSGDLRRSRRHAPGDRARRRPHRLTRRRPGRRPARRTAVTADAPRQHGPSRQHRLRARAELHRPRPGCTAHLPDARTAARRVHARDGATMRRCRRCRSCGGRARGARRRIAGVVHRRAVPDARARSPVRRRPGR